MFEFLEENYREELEKELCRKLKYDFQGDEIDSGIFSYEVEIQNIKFRTFLSHNELLYCVHMAISLLEELKKINNNGISKTKLEEIETTLKNNSDNNVDILLPLRVMNEISTSELESILLDIAYERRVGGAVWMLLARPGLISAIYSVFDKIVDNFDDEELYILSVYFLSRAVMKVRSEEL